MARTKLLLLIFIVSFESIIVDGYPTDCQECVPQGQLPEAMEEYSFTNFFVTIYEHFMCSYLVWKWALFYSIYYFVAKYFFEFIYYPLMIDNYFPIDSTLKREKCKDYNFKPVMAANIATSLLGAVIVFIRCTIYIYSSSHWNHSYYWNCIYITTPQSIVDLLDSFLGYYVYDTLYLFIYRRKWMFLVHHMVVPLATIGVKSFGYGAHVGLLIFVITDITTIFLHLIWFIEDRIKYINYLINQHKDNYKENELYGLYLSFWNKMRTILQLIFSISFCYLRLGHLSYVMIPWLYNVANAKHVNLFYKFIAILGSMALLGTGDLE